MHSFPLGEQVRQHEAGEQQDHYAGQTEGDQQDIDRDQGHGAECLDEEA